VIFDCSLLDVLAKRCEEKGLSGEILVDGRRRPKNFKCITGYVVQVCYHPHRRRRRRHHHSPLFDTFKLDQDKDKALSSKDQDQDQDQDFTFVLKDSLRTRTRTRTTTLRSCDHLENIWNPTSFNYLSLACRACDYVYIDYVRRSRSSSCRLLRPINCLTYITLHHRLLVLVLRVLVRCNFLFLLVLVVYRISDSTLTLMLLESQ